MSYIVTIVPAQPGWRALVWWDFDGKVELEEIPVVCWGLERYGWTPTGYPVPPNQWGDPDIEVSFDHRLAGFGPVEDGHSLADLEEDLGSMANGGYLCWLAPGQEVTDQHRREVAAAAARRREREAEKQEHDRKACHVAHPNQLHQAWREAKVERAPA